MSDSEFDIKYVANLARIALTPEEEARLGSQLGDILGYVKKLEELDVSDVEPMAHAVPLDNVNHGPFRQLSAFVRVEIGPGLQQRLLDYPVAA